jgi:predicted O-methyltransferase YrrM
MSDDRWAKVDDYLDATVIHSDDDLRQTLADSTAGGLPAIAVSPALGQFLHILARSIDARRILEVGTLGGYSGIWLARALPANGRLVTLELDQHHADVARANFRRAGVADLVEVRVGPAIDALAQLAMEAGAPFDLVFIDADKEPYADYLQAALRIVRAGSLIVADNIVREGEVMNAGSTDARVQGVRRYLDVAGSDPRLTTTVIQTVGSKHYDGFALSIVNFVD